MSNQTHATLTYLNPHFDKPIDLALVLGSGLGVLAEEVEQARIISYAAIPGFPQTTVAGHRGRLVYGQLAGRQVLILQGRFHYYEGYDLETVTYPIKILHALNVRNLILTNAAGAANPNFKVGSFMLLQDHINFSFRKVNPLNTNSKKVYDETWLALAAHVTAKLHLKLEQGVYWFNTGPTYETPAEIRMARCLGADAVGMSTVLEATCAHSLGLKVLGISYISNMAAGILKQPIEHNEIFTVMETVKPEFVAILKSIVKAGAPNHSGRPVS